MPDGTSGSGIDTLVRATSHKKVVGSARVTSPGESSNPKQERNRAMALQTEILQPSNTFNDTDAKTQEASKRASRLVDLLNVDPAQGALTLRLLKAKAPDLGGRNSGLVPATEQVLRESIQTNLNLLNPEALKALAAPEVGFLTQEDVDNLLRQKNEMTIREAKQQEQHAQQVKKTDVKKVYKLRETLAKVLDVTTSSVKWLKDMNQEFRAGEILAGLGLGGAGFKMATDIVAGSGSAYTTPVALGLLASAALLLSKKNNN